MIIAIFGPDGTGKTTLARMLERYLSSKEIRTSHIRFKSHHLVMYLKLLFLQKVGAIPTTHSPRILDYSLKRYFSKSNLYLYLELLNAIIWLFVNIKLRKVFGVKVIIAERYVPDFLVSVLIISPNRRILNSFSRILQPFMHNTIKVFLYSSVNDILNRKKDELLTRSYIYSLLRLYMHVIKILGVDLYINTSKYSRIEAFRIVKEFIRNKACGKV